MNVLIASLPSISMVQGGPRTQVMETVRHFPADIRVEFFDPWKDHDLPSIDLVHLFSAGLPTYEIAIRMSHFGIPLVVSPIFYTSHSPVFIRTVRMIERMTNRLGRGVWTDYGLAGHICRLSKRCLPNSHAEARLVERGLGVPSGKIQCIPNGVDERFSRGDPDVFVKKYGIRDFILSVTHIGSARKNLIALLRAVRSIDRPCVIIGKIHHSAYADRCLKEAADNKNVLIIEGLSNDSDLLASAYAACDSFVLPSFYETPGIAALEAALSGAKIVITPHGGPFEYFGNHAVYVDPHSVKSIRSGILSSLARRKSTDLAEHIRAQFLWPRISKLTVNAYQQALE